VRRWQLPRVRRTAKHYAGIGHVSRRGDGDYGNASQRRPTTRAREVEVMLVRWSPQRSDRLLSYQFVGETIIAALDGQTDTFDFSGLPDGELDVSALETTLDICPVLAAR